MADAVIPPAAGRAPLAQPIAPPAAGSAVSRVGQWYMVVALMVIGLVATLDRSCLVLVAPMIKADLQLTDTELSLLIGLSFALFHTLTTVPMGWMVDRFNRKLIVGVGAVLWSLATLGSGLATNFWQLFAGRAGVGFSEGGLGPAGFSLIRDGVSPQRRGRAFSIYQLGAVLGGGLSFVIVGMLIGLIGTETRTVPLLGDLRPWQLMMVILGLVGLPFALLALPMKEPGRGPEHVAEPFVRGYATAGRYMAGRWRIYVPLMLFMGFVAMLGSAYSMWMPSLVTRNFDISLPKLGAQVGAVMIICFPSGMFLSGLAIDLLRKRGMRLAPGYIGIAAMLAVGVPFVFLPLAPTLPLMWAAAYVGMFCLAFASPVGITVTAMVTPRATAGRVQAVCLLIQALIGQAGGPVLIGYLSDTTFAWAGQKSLAYALAACCALLTVCALVCIVLVTRELKRIPLPED